MNRGGLNFFLGLYIILFLILVTPFGALFYVIFGQLSFLLALGSLALAVVVIYMQRQETIRGNKLIDLIVLTPVMATIIIARLLWIKLNTGEMNSGISNEEIALYLILLVVAVIALLLLDKNRIKTN